MAKGRTILSDATVLDGTGSPRFRGDVWVDAGRIEQIAPVADTHPRGWEVVPLHGKMLAPGFVDVHSHADNAALLPTPDLSKICQGVTTEVTGNCGESLAPRHPAFAQAWADYTGRLFPPTEWFGHSFAEYWVEAENRGLVTNIAPLVGHGTLRVGVMGLIDRRPSRVERAEIKDGLRRSLDEGAFGLSTGLIYPPGLFTDTGDIVDLATCLGDRVYATHMRNEADALLESVLEALAIGRDGHCPVQISHHKACGPRNWGKTAHTLALIESAREQGQEVRLDVYPYMASSTVLTSCLPPWADTGSQDAVIRRLDDPVDRQRIYCDIDQGLPGWENDLGALGGEGIVISATPDHRWEGQTLTKVGRALGVDAVAAMLHLLVDYDLRVSMIAFSMDEADLKRVMTFPWTMIGSDGLPPGSGGKPHPRQFGTFPKVLGTYVRERAWLDWETAIAKMTRLSAETFGIPDRGVIRPGFVADLVVFDPETIADRGHYAADPLPPVGINAVYLAGECVVRDGEWLGFKTGRRLHCAL